MLIPFLYFVITAGCILENAPQVPARVAGRQTTAGRLNLNRATVADLEQLPGIGRVLALRIVEYRTRHGAFVRPEDVIIVSGMSGRRYRVIAHLICI